MCDQSTFLLARLWPQSQPAAPVLSLSLLLPPSLGVSPEPPVVGGSRSKGTAEEEAPLVEFLGISSPFSLPFARGLSTGVLENACLSDEAIWSGNEHLQPWDLTPAICPCVSFTPPGCTKICSCSWSGCKMRRWLFKENSLFI